MDEATLERIGEELARLRGESSSSLLLEADGRRPARLYRTRDGSLVRVLDDDVAPLTPAMLRAIEAYTAGQQVTIGDVGMDDDEGDDDGGAVDATADDPESGATDATRNVDDDDCDEDAMMNDIALDGNDQVEMMLPPEPANSAESPACAEDAAPSAAGDHVEADRCDLESPSEEVETPQGLWQRGIPMAAWLNGSDRKEQGAAPMVSDDHDGASKEAQRNSVTDEAETAQPITVDLQALSEAWTPELRDRTRFCYHPHGDTGAHQRRQRCVVYWPRNTYRVSHGNFGFHVARDLAQRHEVPLVVVMLLPRAIMYPVRHAATVDEALLRWSVVDVRTRLDTLGIPVYGFTPSDIPPGVEIPTSIEAGCALAELFEAFSPLAVVTDECFSSSARNELEAMRQHLHIRRRANWLLLAVDSSTCVPFYRRCDRARQSLECNEAPLVSEGDFTNEYIPSLRDHPISPVTEYSVKFEDAEGVRFALKANLGDMIAKLNLEEVVWKILESMNAQAAANVSSTSETAALSTLEIMFSAYDERPAIQQELQGAGMLSLLPYIRHGSMFSGFVLDRLNAVIASMPRPSDTKSRKFLAALKVYRSRAITHLGRERDYSLYLSLWACSQLDRDPLTARRSIGFRGIHSFQHNLSELDTYSRLFPSWINTELTPLSTATSISARYDPYQLEAGRTDDVYWNEIQLFLIANRYLHPMVVLYWSFRVIQWSLSPWAGVATIDALLNKASLGFPSSPDTIFSIWNQLFGTRHKCAPNEDSPDGFVDFCNRIEAELANQSRLQLRR